MMKKIIVITIIIILLGCSGDNQSEKITVGTVKYSLDHFILYYSKSNIKNDKFRFVFFDTYAELRDSFISEDIDLAITPLNEQIAEIEDEIVPLTLLTANGFGLVSIEQIDEISILRQKNIGYLGGTHGKYLIDKIDKKNSLGIKTENYDSVKELSNAIYDREVFAGLLFVPFVFQMRSSAKEFLFIDALISDYSSSFLIGHQEVLKRNFDEINKLIRLNQKNTDEFLDRPFLLYEMMKDYYGNSKKITKESFYRTRFVSKTDSLFSNWKENYKQLINFYNAEEN